jgi:hypothetical protein
MAQKDVLLTFSALAKSKRKFGTIAQLVVLSNLESMNAVFIHNGLNQSERLTQLNRMAISQLTSLLNYSGIKKLE